LGNSPFLTDIDPSAVLNGSRDPLGCQLVWARFGRHVVGNLSTVSNSLRDFTVLIIGYHFVELVREEKGPGTEVAAFLRWEQLASYARVHVNRETRFRGTERTQKFLSDSPRVTISDDRAFQTLGNQKLYGIWGLYSVPGRASGILEGDPLRLTPAARELLQTLYLPRLNEKRVLELVAKPRSVIDVEGKDLETLRSVASLLKTGMKAVERTFYRNHLLCGGPHDSNNGLQRQMAELIEPELGRGDLLSPPGIRDLAEKAHARGIDWEPLANRLERIRHCESVLAPMSALFTWLLGCDKQGLDDVAAKLREAWGDGVRTISLDEVRALRAEFGGNVPEVCDRWMAIAETAATGDYGALVELLVVQSAAVMKARGGSPWVEVRQGRLAVHVRSEKGWLPEQEELPTIWRFPYFIDSMRAIAAGLKEN